jgi:hypothetical protein
MEYRKKMLPFLLDLAFREQSEANPSRMSAPAYPFLGKIRRENPSTARPIEMRCLRDRKREPLPRRRVPIRNQ